MHFQTESDDPSIRERLRLTRSTASCCTKQKKIKKQKKIQIVVTRSQSPSKQQQINDIQDFIRTNGQEYFSRSASDTFQIFRDIVRSNLHVKQVLSSEPNVYNIHHFQQCEKSANRYLDLIEKLANAKHHQLGIHSQQMRAYLRIAQINMQKATKHQSKTIMLDQNEYILYQQRQQISNQIELFLNKLADTYSQSKNIDVMGKQILTLCKMSSVFEGELLRKVQARIMKYQTQLHDIQKPPSHTISDQYCSLLIRKNLRMSLDETSIDLINYFMIAQAKEKNVYRDIPLKKIDSVKELKQYLKTKRVKPGRNLLNTLKTCCSGCCSDYYQISNPIKTCNQCGIRAHTLCQNIKGKCQSCKSHKKNAQSKSTSQVCVICQRQKEKGLLTQRVKSGNLEYVHTFCLLIHNLWEIQNGFLKQKIIKQQNAVFCKICNKSTNISIKSQNDYQFCHGMCAFLQGYPFTINQNSITVEFDVSDERRSKLSLQRKYKLNFQKILFKNNQIFNEMEKQ